MAIESDHAVTDSEPSFGFDTFGDSNIDFWVFMQATDRIGAWYLKSDLIKLIHQRFNDAGIAINYPMRHLVVDDKENADSGEATAPEKIVEFVRRG